MFLVRNRSAATLITRFLRNYAREFAFNRNKFVSVIINRDSPFSTISYETPAIDMKSPSPKSPVENALTVLQIADRNKIKIILMNIQQKEAYFDNLWKSLLEDKYLKIQSIVKFLQIKVDCGLEVSYERAIEDLKSLGLKPDARFFSVFIKKACENGDMEKTSVYLKAMHKGGIIPNDYIFSKILHGYVKCGLPDEVATTQDVMSKMNYWPSIMATEDLLSAYADLGDGASVFELLQDSFNKSETMLNLPSFSHRFLADLYRRLTFAPQLDNNEQALMKILDLLKQRPPGFDDHRIGASIIQLLQAGHFQAAFHLLKNTRPHRFSPFFLSRIPEVIPKQNPELLNDFWFASGSIGRLPETIRSMSLENAIRTLRAGPPLRAELHSAVANAVVLNAVKKNDIDSVVEIGHILGDQRHHFLYLSVIPRLLMMRLSPDEVVSKFEKAVFKSCAALGVVLNDICALPHFLPTPVTGCSVENASSLISKFRSEGLLPFTEFLPSKSSSTHLLLRGCLYYSDTGHGISQAKLDAWADAAFSCFSAERHPLLASSLLRVCSEASAEEDSAQSAKTEVEPVNPSPSPLPSSSGFASLTLAARQELALKLAAYFANKKMPIASLDFIRKSLKNVGVPTETLASLRSSGNMSKVTLLAERLQAGEIDSVTEELQKLQKAISRETSPLFPNAIDLLGKALTVTEIPAGTYEGGSLEGAPLPVSRYSPAQLEALFWALGDVAGLKNPSLSAAKVGEQYCNVSDFTGLAAFVDKVSDRCPQNLSSMLSNWFLQQLIRLDVDQARQLLDKTLQKDTLSLPMVCLGAQNFAALLDTSDVKNDMGVKLLTKRLEGMNQLRKVRAVHSAVEDLCRNRHLFAAYAVRDWACRLGLTLLPQTTETILSSSVFIDSPPRLPPSMLTPELVSLRGGITMTHLLTQLKEVITTSSSEEGNAVVSTASIEAAANALSNHPFLVDPESLMHSLRPGTLKKTQFAFWSAIGQTLNALGSPFAQEDNLTRLASRLVELGHEASILSWISCLLRPSTMAALCLGGLLSPESNLNFVQLLRRRPELQIAVATSRNLSSLTQEQKDALTRSFNLLENSALLGLSNALLDKNFTQAKSIIEHWQGDPEIVLADLVNSQPNNYLPLVAEFISEDPMHSKVALINRILERTQFSKAPTRLIIQLLEMSATPNLRQEETPNFGCLKDRLSISNQVFLRALFKIRSAPRFMLQGFASGFDYVESFLPGASNSTLRNTILQATRQGKSQVIFEALASFQESSELPYLQKAASVVILSQLLTSGYQNVMPLLYAACDKRNGDLLDACASAAFPFLHNSQGVAFKALADLYRQRELDPVALEAISFNRLNEFTTPLVVKRDTPKLESLSLKFDKPGEEDFSDPVRLAKESVSSLASILASNKLTETNSALLIDVVRKLWGPGRVDLILCHLVELRAVKSVDLVIECLPTEMRERRLPFRALANLIDINSTSQSSSNSSNEDKFCEAVDALLSSPPQCLTHCLNGPHTAVLFSTWPQSSINKATEVVGNTLGRSKSILLLQLAASLVHRGLVGDAAKILEGTGPLPFNFLAGSLHHPLDRPAFQKSVKYLESLDSEHLPVFVDTSLRNAAMSTRNGTSPDAVVTLVKTALEEPSINLKKFCQPTTMRLLREATKHSQEVQQALFLKPTDPKVPVDQATL